MNLDAKIASFSLKNIKNFVINITMHIAFSIAWVT